jgi:hypothetical protein
VVKIRRIRHRLWTEENSGTSAPVADSIHQFRTRTQARSGIHLPA